MKKIAPNETEIVGQWVLHEGRIISDKASQRIGELVDCYLVEICRDPSGWDALYCDPDDGRLWELTYPQSGLQGGGPPQLRCVAKEEVELKYGSGVLSR